MIGLPAVALAMWGCAIVYRPDRPGLVRGTIAGLVFALSLQTKLFAAAALPAFLAIAYLSGEEETPARRIQMVAVALSGAAVGFVAIEIMVGVPLWRQLVEPRIAAEVRFEYSFFDCPPFVSPSI